MRVLHWRDISPRGEHLHVASISTAWQRTPGLHGHDFYECFLIQTGSGQHVRPHGAEEVGPNEVYFVCPAHVHAVTARRGEGLEFLNVAIAAPVFRLARRSLPGLGLLWDDGDIRSKKLPVSLAVRLRRLALEAAEGPHDEADAIYFLAGLVRSVTRDLSRPVGVPYPEWLHEALLMADDPEVLRVGLPALVRLCGRSREHVNRVFRKYLAMTPTGWIAAARIRRAAFLLRTTRQSVLEVCLECGFESPSYFHRLFRETMGVTPLRYRRETDWVVKPAGWRF